MSQIGKNIRKIRATKGLSQAAFANLFNITRASVGAYEEGRAEPKTDIMLQIANYFSIPIKSLLTEELTVNQLANFNVKAIIDNEATLKKKSIPFINNSNWNDFFNDPDYTEENNTVDFPPNFINGEIAIEITNQIISDYDNGTIIICSPIKVATEDTAYLLITKEKSSISSLSEIESLQTQETRIYTINQKIETIRKGNKNSLEERLDALEKIVNQLTKK